MPTLKRLLDKFTAPDSQIEVIDLSGREVEFVLRRRYGRRGIGLKIDEKGLIVSAPLSTSKKRIHDAVREQSAWILLKMDVWQARRVPAPKWEEGEKLPYLGGDIILQLCPQQPIKTRLGHEQLGFTFDDTTPVMHLPKSKQPVPLRVIKWYKQQALPHFTARVDHYAEKLGVSRPRVMLSSANTRWGSCSHKSEIRLSWRLLKAPPHLIDYVVAHEVAHLKEMNHSPAFWHTVHSLYPDYIQARKELEQLEPRYRTF
ncbi:MAG: SprT family zinc-dependent metalloprotease [Burkholderiales bacterium]